MSTQRQTNNNGINYEYKGYNICIRVEGEQLILEIKNKKKPDNYSKSFSLSDLIRISKFFRMNDNISESFKEISKLIKENKVEITEENELISLEFSINLATIKTFILECEKENYDFELHLITQEEKQKLKEFIGKDKKVKLLYRASRDGDKANNFYEKCENQGPTLTLVLTTTQRKFGGYTSLSWTRPKEDFKYYKDENAFLFSLNKKKKYFTKTKGDSKGVCMYKDKGPAFGKGNDFVIFDGCTTNTNSYSNCPYTYKTVRNELLGGQYNFQVKDYEVYSVN